MTCREGMVQGAGLVLAALAAGCGPPSVARPGPRPTPAAVQPTPVRVVRPERRTIRRVIEQPSDNIEAYQRTPVFAKIAGFVRTVNADIGDRVNKDQLLAALWVPETEVELRQKEAAVRQAEAEVFQAKAAVDRAEAEHRRAQSQAERLARLGRSNGVIDRENVDEARLGAEAAAAAVDKAKADVRVAEARVQVARAVRDQVATMLAYTRVAAPFDGIVTRRNVDTGHFVQPAAGGTKGEPLFIVEETDPVRVFVDVPEGEAAWVRDGQTARVRLRDLGGEEVTGRVTRTAGVLSPQARTLRTEIDLPNADGRLRPGMFVHVAIVVERTGVWALPTSAVVSGTEGSYCVLVEDGKAVRTPLRLGLVGADFVEVRQKKAGKSGGPGGEPSWGAITGEEQVVVGNPAGIPDGQAVMVSKDSPSQGAK